MVWWISSLSSQENQRYCRMTCSASQTADFVYLGRIYFFCPLLSSLAVTSLLCFSVFRGRSTFDISISQDTSNISTSSHWFYERSDCDVVILLIYTLCNHFLDAVQHLGIFASTVG